ncbi:MAG TPA: FG-GAP-like repeat-containing protein [Ideonella sp.]|uniref:FG-GAP-like repeat-containing protein n=1 Tax=Ideonella sp. TaxID=1929293 RepID=UPI002CBFE2A3|nr:FG-GAP-like repeat-containing protein [Ideonella sp.]HSI48657.1 FG-GAP-like repeat-containing protein [Ideonella sp.]
MTCHLLRKTAAATTLSWGLGLLASAPAFAAANLAVNDTSIEPSRFTSFLQFVVTRSGNTGFAALVDYATVDGTALAGRDYTSTHGTLSFAPGQVQLVVDVPLVGKPVPQARSFTLALSNPVAQPATGRVWVEAGSASIGRSPQGAVVADFNGDGLPDVAMSSATSSAPAITLLRNDTAKKAKQANFTALASLPVVAAPMRLGSADLNRDGRPDLVTSVTDTTAISVFLNTTPVGAADLRFDRSDVALGDSATTDVAFADFDGDGVVDVVLATGFGSKALVLRNTTPAGATQPTLTLAASLPGSPQAGSYSYVVRTLDVNGDGKPDIAVGNLLSADVSLLLNTTPAGGPIRFAPPIAVSLPGGVSGMDVADLDGDGRPDIVTADNDSQQTGSTFSVLLNRTPTGSARPVFTVSSRSDGAPYEVRLADMDGDGKPDLVFTNLVADDFSNGAMVIYLNKTAPGADAPALTRDFAAFIADEPHALAVGDFNGDGKADVVSADFVSFSDAGPSARFLFGQKPAKDPKATLIDASGTATLTPKARSASAR